MSLLGLLTIGRAFGSVRNRPAPFRVTNDLLPNFGRERAFAGAETNEIQTHAAATEPARQASPEPQTNLAPELPLNERQTIPPLVATQPVKPEAEKSRQVTRTRRRTRGGVPVQGELSLEAVRVVRNDLYADDLELIPRSRPAGVASLLKTERPRRNPASAGWRGWLAHWRQWFRWQAG